MASPQDLYQQGQQALASGETTTAYNLFIEAIEADPDFVDAWAALLPLADAETQPEILEQIEALDPDHPSLFSDENEEDELAVAEAIPADIDEFDPRNLLGEQETLAEDDAEEKELFDLVRGPVLSNNDNRFDLSGVTARLNELPGADALNTARDAVEQRLLSSPTGKNEIIPGITQNDVRIYGLGLLLFTVCLFSFTFIAVSTRNGATIAEQTAVAQAIIDQDATRTAQAIDNATVVQAQTDQAFFITRTAELSTQSAREASVRATLPPPPTPTATPTTVSLRVDPLPPPEIGISGSIIVWGGNNPANDGYYQPLVFDPTVNSSGREFSIFVRELTMSRDGQTYVFRAKNSVGDESLFDLGSTETNARSLAPFFRPEDVIADRQPSTTADGQIVVFIAENRTLPNALVYRLDNTDNSLTLLTPDDGSYSGAAVSPDGTQVVAVRRGAGGTDLVLIDLTDPAFPQTPFTQDGDRLLEAWPYFSTDGRQVVYSAATNTSPDNHDLYVIGINSQEGGNVFIESDADEIHPVFSPDSRFVAYASNAVGGTYNLFVYDIVTNTNYQITEDDRNPYFPGGWVEFVVE